MSDHVLINPAETSPEFVRERAFIDSLRDLCVTEMKRIGNEEAEKRLGLLPRGVRVLHWNKTWTVEEAFRIAILLDLPVIKRLEGAVIQSEDTHRNPLNVSEVFDRLPLITLVQTCGACPEQYDAFLNGRQVGYLRLRHGEFRVDVPDCRGETIFLANPEGDGTFEDWERERYLTKAKEAIAKWLAEHPEFFRHGK